VPPSTHGLAPVSVVEHRPGREPGRLAGDELLQDTWTQIRSRLQQALPDGVWETWLGGLQPQRIDHSVLYVEAPDHARHWIQRRFVLALGVAATSVDPSIERVELTGTPTDSVPPARARQVTAINSSLSLKPTNTFSRFVIGASNRFAHAAALAVAEMPAQAYNPLFIYGPTGIGKTHLLHAIGNYVTSHEPGLAIQYTTVEAFTNHFMSALQRNDVESFKQTYRQNDVLLLDDVDFLEGKKKTTEEFFYTFDAVSSAGAQMVLSGSSHPSHMPLLDVRLRERFQSGLIVDLHPPDEETRLAILQKLASLNSSQIDQAVLNHIAKEVSSNICVLEGALIRVVAFASLTENPITIDLVEKVLSNLYANSPKSHRSTGPTIAEIQHQTAAALSLDVNELLSTHRGRHVVYARQVAMYLSRELTQLSLSAIAQLFGGRDHTTVLHAHRKIRARALQDADTRSLITTISEHLQTTHNQNTQVDL
jgi:chromosomal replication initiator protein